MLEQFPDFIQQGFKDTLYLDIIPFSVRDISELYFAQF
jgi:hypothetical protein